MPTPSPSPSPTFDPAHVQAQLRDLAGATTGWVGSHWLQILIAIAAATVLFLLLHAAKLYARRLCRRDATVLGWGTIFGRAVSRTSSVFMVLLAAKLVAGYAHPPGEIATTIGFLFTIAAVFQAAIWAREILLGAIEYRAHSEHYAGEALVSALGLIRLLVSFAVFAIAFVVVLDNLGVNVTGLVAGLGVGGIAIGLAAQGIFADLFAALAIIFDRPFRRGDTIGYDKTTGTVEAIGLKSTRIRAPTGEERIISNKQLLDKEIQNITRRDYRRVIFTLGVACWTPPETMRRLPDMIQQVVEAQGQKFVRCGFTTFSASSYDFDLEFDSPSADFNAFFAARHQVGLAVIERLKAEKIDLAYPTQTSFTAAPDGHMVMPYPEVQPVRVDGSEPPRSP